YRAPVPRGRAGPHRPPPPVAKPHTLHEGETIRQLQANLHPRDSILPGWVYRGSATCGILIYPGPIGLHTTASQEADYIAHDLLEARHMVWHSPLAIGGRLDRCFLLAPAPAAEDGPVPIRTEEATQERAHDRHGATLIQHERW